MRGKELFEIVVGSKSWVHRRVDKINLVSAGRTRMQISLDVTVPKNLKTRANSSAKGLILPLALMLKGPQRAFSVQDADGSRLPIITTDQHADYVVEMLQYALKICDVRVKSGFSADDLTRRLRAMVKSYSENDREETYKSLLTVLQFGEGGIDTELLSFAKKFLQTFKSSYLIFVVIDTKYCGTRHVFKVEYDEHELGRRAKKSAAGHVRRRNAVKFLLGITDPGFASSYHIEIVVPDELEVGEAWIEWGYPFEPTSLGKNSLHMEIPRDGQRIAHVSSPDIGRFATGALRFMVKPAREGLQYFATCSLCTVLALVTVAELLQWLPPHAILGNWNIPSDAASLFLVAPALFLSWFAKPAENAVTFRVLYPLRLLLLWLAGILLAMAFAAVVPLVRGAWWCLWIGVVAGSVLAFVYWFQFCRYSKFSLNFHQPTS